MNSTISPISTIFILGDVMTTSIDGGARVGLNVVVVVGTPRFMRIYKIIYWNIKVQGDIDLKKLYPKC